MVNSVEHKNFKSWRALPPLEFGRITGLFGPNSSGKTGILQVLLMLKQTAESLDRTRVLHLGDERSLVDLGTFYDMAHDHRSDEPFEFVVSWTLPKTLGVTDPETKSEVVLSESEVRFDMAVRQVGEGSAVKLVVETFHYTMGQNSFGMEYDPDASGEHGEPRYEVKWKGYELKRKRGRPWPLPSPIKSYGFPDQVANYFKNADFLSDLALAFDDLMSNISYVGPLRENPHRVYFWGGERPSSVGQRGELAVEALLAARAEDRKIPRRVDKRNRYVKFDVRIAEHLRQMGLIHSFAVKPIGRNRKEYEVRIQQSPEGAEVLITDVGFGVSQVLPVLVQSYFAPEQSVVVFEQPEIHLHPNVQAALADVFIDAVEERNIQILVESHSEHLLRRLQRRIAEGRISSDDVALYFVNFDGRESRIERLAVDAWGNITNWPEDFFGDELGELTAMATAAARRAA